MGSFERIKATGSVALKGFSKYILKGKYQKPVAI
jgi:hypothetical protein